MAEARKRDVLPDLLKALLMLSVLLQHSATALKTGLPIGDGNWTNWLSASPFNMPLFMGICGYYFFHSAQKRSLAELLKSRLCMIMVPCLAWIMLGKCAERFLYGLHVDWCPWPWGLWFLWSVLICTLLGCICHYAFRRVEGWVMALLCGLLCLLPFDPYNVAYMFPFFAMGHMVGKYNLASRLKPWMGWAALAAYIGLHCFITRESAVWESHSFLFGERPVEVQLGLNAYRLLIGAVGSIAFYCIVKCIYTVYCTAPCKVLRHPLLKWYVIALGQYSLVVYASQAVFLELCTGRLMKTLAWHGLYNPQAIPFQVFQWVCIPFTAFIMSLLCLATLRLAQTNRITQFLFIGKA